MRGESQERLNATRELTRQRPTRGAGKGHTQRPKNRHMQRPKYPIHACIKMRNPPFLRGTPLSISGAGWVRDRKSVVRGSQGHRSAWGARIGHITDVLSTLGRHHSSVGAGLSRSRWLVSSDRPSDPQMEAHRAASEQLQECAAIRPV